MCLSRLFGVQVLNPPRERFTPFTGFKVVEAGENGIFLPEINSGGRVGYKLGEWYDDTAYDIFSLSTEYSYLAYFFGRERRKPQVYPLGFHIFREPEAARAWLAYSPKHETLRIVEVHYNKVAARGMQRVPTGNGLVSFAQVDVAEKMKLVREIIQE